MRYQIKYDENFLLVLQDANIFQRRSSDGQYYQRFKIGDEISCHPTTCIEEFTTFAEGQGFISAGSFSTLMSELPLSTITGRYTSFAHSFNSMGYRHPIESICMNPASFHQEREHLSAYFNAYEAHHGVISKPRVPTPQPQNDPITLGNDVWIGSNVTIAGGITIGDGAVIASNSVVTKDVEAYSVVAGIPAKHRKYRFSLEVVEALQQIKWWNYELGELYQKGLDFSSPASFISKFREVEKDLKPLQVRRFFPYLYQFGHDITARNRVGDYHGKILYYDLVNDKIVHLQTLDSEAKPITISSIEERFYLSIDDVVLINFDEQFNVTLTNNHHEINYQLTMKEDQSFYIQQNDRYLCSRGHDFIWQRHLDRWEHFYSFR